MLSAVMVVSFFLTGCSGKKDDGTVTITNVSYDPTREFYEKYNIAEYIITRNDGTVSVSDGISADFKAS